MDRGGRLRFIKVATQIAPPIEPPLARSRPRGSRGSFLRRAAHQLRIGPCGASLVGIRTAGNRPMSTNWRHAASGCPRHLRAPSGMAPFCRHRTIPGCPDVYRRCYARSTPKLMRKAMQSPRLMRCAPPRRTEACARRPPDLRARPTRSGLDLRRDIVKTRPSSCTHTPATSHTTRTSHSADSTRSGSG